MDLERCLLLVVPHVCRSRFRRRNWAAEGVHEAPDGWAAALSTPLHQDSQAPSGRGSREVWDLREARAGGLTVRALESAALHVGTACLCCSLRPRLRLHLPQSWGPESRSSPPRTRHLSQPLPQSAPPSQSWRSSHGRGHTGSPYNGPPASPSARCARCSCHKRRSASCIARDTPWAKPNRGS